MKVFCAGENRKPTLLCSHWKERFLGSISLKLENYKIVDLPIVAFS
jgi:hypothetical protein